MSAYTGSASVSSGVDKEADLAWVFFHTIGPLNYAINWRASALSRVSIVAAEIQPGMEPQILESGPAVDAVEMLKWDESKIMSGLSVQTDVPGRGYLVGQQGPDDQVARFEVFSREQVRIVKDTQRRQIGQPPVYELNETGAGWVRVPDAMVIPVRHADPQYSYLDTSTTRAALTVLREIDLYDKELVATLVSRIANNGLLFVPSEVSFPNRSTQNDNEDPFTYELIETARVGIADPGSASAAIPIPLRVPSQYIEAFRHLKLSDPVDANVLSARSVAYERLADTLNLPREIITGVSAASHWGAWALEESAIKTHIAPSVELICGQLTTGFLYPQLIANKKPLTGPNGGRLVVWYDASALVLHPDLSQKAIELYDRVELSGDALRRESGFSEDDAPDGKQTRDQILRKVSSNGQLAFQVIDELTGIQTGQTNVAQAVAPQATPVPSPSEVPAEGPPNNGEMPATTATGRRR